MVPISNSTKTFLQSWIDEGIVDPAKFFADHMYCAFGKGPAFAHDQTTSLSQAHRDAAFMKIDAQGEDTSAFIASIYNITSKDVEIPAYLGANHLSAIAFGPLKSDPTKPCDLNMFTTIEDANEKCFSSQEAVWGSNDTVCRLGPESKYTCSSFSIFEDEMVSKWQPKQQEHQVLWLSLDK